MRFVLTSSIYGILLLTTIQTFCQSSKIVKKKITLTGKNDTIYIEEYNLSGKSTFFKSFTKDGISMITTFRYSGEKVLNQIWAHSNVGFIISEFSYDTVENRVLRFSYELKRDNEKHKPKYLDGIHSEIELRQTKDFKRIYRKRNRYLKEVHYYTDTLATKEIEFDRKGDTLEVKTNTYENGLLKNWFGTYVGIGDKKKRPTEGFFEYDSDKNEISAIVIINKDTSSQWVKRYENNKLVEEKRFGWEGLELIIQHEYFGDSIKVMRAYTGLDDPFPTETKLKYGSGLLLNKMQFNGESALISSTDYFYNIDKTFVKKIETLPSARTKVTNYIYEYHIE